MPIQRIVQTSRFRLREFIPADRDPFIASHVDAEFAKHHMPDERGCTHAASVFELILDWQNAVPRLNYQFVVAPKESPSVYIGNIGARMEGLPSGHAELGVELLPVYWNNGVASELTSAFIPWVRETLGVSEFHAETAFGNKAAERLARAAGFAESGGNDKRHWRFGSTDNG